MALYGVSMALPFMVLVPAVMSEGVSAVFNSELEARSWEACVLVLLAF